MIVVGVWRFSIVYCLLCVVVTQSLGGSLRERRLERLRQNAINLETRREALERRRQERERQREVENELRENERRQRELQYKRDNEVQAEWRQYLNELRESNAQMRIAISQGKQRLVDWDKYCCATLENGEKCSNVVNPGAWFCKEHGDPPLPERRDVLKGSPEPPVVIDRAERTAAYEVKRRRSKVSSRISKQREKRILNEDGESGGRCAAVPVLCYVVGVGAVIALFVLGWVLVGRRNGDSHRRRQSRYSSRTRIK